MQERVAHGRHPEDHPNVVRGLAGTREIAADERVEPEAQSCEAHADPSRLLVTQGIEPVANAVVGDGRVAIIVAVADQIDVVDAQRMDATPVTGDAGGCARPAVTIASARPRAGRFMRSRKRLDARASHANGTSLRGLRRA